MKKIEPFIKYIVLALLVYVPIFGHLNTLPIRIWDESRLATNAYEMLKNGNFIVTYFDGKPDMWNTKPPLLIWLDVLFMKMFGVNELAVRLPSALAGLFVCILLLVFSKKFFKNIWFGYIFVIVLITCNGYINIHATRTGDYDSLLTLFTTLSGLLFFTFCEKQNYKYLYLFFLFISLAVLTKGISGLLFLPALMIYSVFQKKFFLILKSKHFYFGLFSFLIIVFGYYFLRESYNIGYIKAVQENELGGRYLKTIEDHHHDFWFYYSNLIDFQIKYWHLLIPCGLIIGLFNVDKKLNRLTLFSTLMIICYFIVISTAKTKLIWYDVPLYPFLAILITVFIFSIFQFFQFFKPINDILKVNVFPFIFIFLVTINPYRDMVNKTFKPKEFSWDKNFYETGYYLKDAVKGKYNLNDQYLIFDGYKAHYNFYIKILNDKGVRISIKNSKEIKKHDIVFTNQEQIKNFIEMNYEYEKLFPVGDIDKYKIIKRKNLEINVI